MRFVVFFVLLAGAAIAAAWWVAGLPGTVSGTIGTTSFETSAPVALTLLGLLFILLYSAIRLVAWLFSLPRRAKRGNERRRRVKGDRAVTRALVALAANDPAMAQREAARSRRLLGRTPLTLLLEAQSSRQAGREAEADASFRQLAGTPDAAFLGHRGLLQQATAREDWAAAQKHALEAEAAYPGAAWVRQERRQLALRTGQFKDALRLSGSEHQASLGVAAADAETDSAESLRLAKQAFDADPALPAAALAYATRLRKAGRDKVAVGVLRRAWAKQPHPDLAAEALAPIKDRIARLNAAKGLASANPGHPESRLMQAQAALDAGLTGEARRHLKAAQDVGLNQRRLWVMMADIAERDGNKDEAQEALRRAAVADPDPVWRCGHCGSVHAAWQPVCDACGTPGQVAWVQPDASGPPAPSPARLKQDIEGIPS